MGLPTQITLQMKIYAYHLEHPKMSQWQMALHFNCSKSTIQRTYVTMEQTIG